MKIPLHLNFTPDFNFEWGTKRGAPETLLRNTIKLSLPLHMYRRRIYVFIGWDNALDTEIFVVDAKVIFFREGQPCSGEIVYRNQETPVGETPPDSFVSVFPETSYSANSITFKSRDGTCIAPVSPLDVNIEADTAILRIESIKSQSANLAAFLAVHSEYPV